MLKEPLSMRGLVKLDTKLQLDGLDLKNFSDINWESIVTRLIEVDKFLQYNADNTIADGLLFECCQELGIDSCNPNIIYNRIYDIV